MVWYSIISVGDVTEVNSARAVQINLKQQIYSALNNEQWLFYENGFARTSLSATVTRVSNFVEENVFLFLHRQGSPSSGILVHSVTHCPTRQMCRLQYTQHVQRIE